MRFEDLEERMRGFELAGEVRALLDTWIVIRIEVLRFRRIRKELGLDEPSDERWREGMVETCTGLLDLGFHVRYVHTHGPEISILLDRYESTHGRRILPIATRLAGEASAHLSGFHGQPVPCRAHLAQLPDLESVIDHLRWRLSLAERNALNSHAYWTLRRAGHDAVEATRLLEGLPGQEKFDLLTASGTPFEKIPAWQRRGIGFDGFGVYPELLGGEEYGRFLQGRIDGSGGIHPDRTS